MYKYIVIDGLDCNAEEKIKEADGEVFTSSLDAYVYAGIVNNLKFNMHNEKYKKLENRIKYKAVAMSIFNNMSVVITHTSSLDELMRRINKLVLKSLNEELFIIETIDIWGKNGKYFKIDNRVISTHTTISSEAGLMPTLKVYDNKGDIVYTYDFMEIGLTKSQVIKTMSNMGLTEIK